MAGQWSLGIHLSLPPSCWNFNQVLPYPAFKNMDDGDQTQGLLPVRQPPYWLNHLPSSMSRSLNNELGFIVTEWITHVSSMDACACICIASGQSAIHCTMKIRSTSSRFWGSLWLFLRLLHHSVVASRFLRVLRRNSIYCLCFISTNWCLGNSEKLYL